MAKAQPKPMTDLSGRDSAPVAKSGRIRAVAQTTAVPVTVPSSPRKGAKTAAATTTSAKPRVPKPKTLKTPAKKAALTPLAFRPEVAGPVSAPARFAAAPRRLAGGLQITAAVLVLIILGAVSFEIAYAGKILPGVTADGVGVAGLTPAAAAARITAQAAKFDEQQLTVAYGTTELRIPVAGLAPSYNATKAAAQAAAYGRTGNLAARLHQQLRTLFGRPTTYAVYSFDASRLTPYLLQLDNSITTPVQNAGLSFNGDHAVVSNSATGSRLDIGALATDIAGRLGGAPHAPRRQHLSPRPAHALVHRWHASRQPANTGLVASSHIRQVKLISIRPQSRRRHPAAGGGRSRARPRRHQRLCCRPRLPTQSAGQKRPARHAKQPAHRRRAQSKRRYARSKRGP